MEVVPVPVRSPARQQEAGESARRLREDEKGVAHRRRAEPFMSGERVGTRSERLRAGRVRPHVRAPLLLRHPHPDQRASLLDRGTHPRVVIERGDARRPLVQQIRLPLQRRKRRVRHRDGTAMTRFCLRDEQHLRRARDVRAFARIAPRTRMDAASDG